MASRNRLSVDDSLCAGDHDAPPPEARTNKPSASVFRHKRASAQADSPFRISLEAFKLVLEQGPYETDRPFTFDTRSDFNQALALTGDLRCEYESSSLSITLSAMPTALHESMVKQITRAIEERFDDLKTQTSNASELELINRIGTGDTHGITFNLIDGTKSGSVPDMQWAVSPDPTPTVILEVSYSQPLKAAKAKAKKILTEAGGTIRLMIIVDVAYNQIPLLEASVGTVTCTMKDGYPLIRWSGPKLFRSHQDLDENDIALELRLSHFCQDLGEVEDRSLSFTKKDFDTMLSVAEKKQLGSKKSIDLYGGKVVYKNFTSESESSGDDDDKIDSRADRVMKINKADDEYNGNKRKHNFS